MMKKFLPVLISVALLLCAMTLPPLRLFKAFSFPKAKSGNGTEIVSVEEFTDLLACMRSRSNQTIMTMQGVQQNFVLSADGATAKADGVGLANEKYTSWTTVFDISASMYAYGYFMDMNSTMKIIVDGSETYYHFEDVSINSDEFSASYDAELYYGNGIAIIKYNDISVGGTDVYLKYDEEMIGRWVHISSAGELGDELIDWMTSGMASFFEMLDEGIREAMAEGEFHETSDVYRTEVDGADLTINLRSSENPSAEISYEDDGESIYYSIEFSGINSTDLDFDLDINIFDVDDFVKEND